MEDDFVTNKNKNCVTINCRIILIFRDIDRLTLKEYHLNLHWYLGIFYKKCNFLRVSFSFVYDYVTALAYFIAFILMVKFYCK